MSPGASRSEGLAIAERAGARRAALLLHSMGLEDRRWMLDALPGPQQTQLVALLAELQAIGIARDPLLIETVTTTADTPPGNAPTAAAPMVAVPAEDTLQRLDERQLVVLIEALRLEPTALVVHVLRMENWAWRDRLLHALPDGQRRAISRLLAAAGMPPVPSALRTALLDGLRQAVAAPQSELTQPQRARSRWTAPLRLMLRRPASAGSVS